MFCFAVNLCFHFVESAARRPKLKLLPRSVGEPPAAKADSGRNASIFGTGKPRDEVANERTRTQSGGSNQ